MKQRKMRSINALVGALAEAESKLYNEDSTDLKGLCTLLKDFLKRDDTPERVRLRREFEAGLPLTGEDGLRRKLGAIDMEFFGRAYFPHYFSRPSPEFHRELDAIWQQGVLKGRYPLTPADTKAISRLPGVRRAVAAPRGHAKSTNLTFKGTMHSTLYGYKHYPIIISDSSEQAEGFLDNIRVEFEENTAILEDFGPLAGSVWRSNVLVTKTNIKIEAIGSGKKIRGRKHRNWRPDLIILDDVENDENVRTPEQRSKLKNWFDKAVSKSGDDYTDIVYIGTLLHYDSLLAKTLTNPAYRSIKYKAVIQFSQADDLWQQWESIFTDLANDDREADALAFFQAHKAAMLEGTQVLWEEKLSYYDLMVMRVSEGEASFNSEEQNEPINPDDCLFMEEWFEYYNEAEINFRDPVFDFFGFIDPSLGKTKRSDFSAIVTLAKHRSSGYISADGLQLLEHFFQSIDDHNLLSQTAGCHIIAHGHPGAFRQFLDGLPVFGCHPSAELDIFFHVVSSKPQIKWVRASARKLCERRAAAVPVTRQTRCWPPPRRCFPRVAPPHAPSATSGLTRRFFFLAGVYSPHLETARKSPHNASAGSTGSTARTPWVSSLSARCSSMSRLPLLRRTTTEMPILLSASRFCTICRDTFLGEIRSTPTGSIRSDSSVGVPINSVWSCISSERR